MEFHDIYFNEAERKYQRNINKIADSITISIKPTLLKEYAGCGIFTRQLRLKKISRIYLRFCLRFLFLFDDPYFVYDF
jgi:hypothetical protein